MEGKSAITKQQLQNHPTPAGTWVDYFPSNIRPYLYLVRADRPAGTLLLFYPCAWSVTMTCYALSVPIATAWTYVGFFLLASLVFRSAGCVINDMWDKNIDAAVSRTRTRPLAAGDLTRSQAFIFLIPQLALGVWLFMQLNAYRSVISHLLLFLYLTILGLSSLGLVVLYPAMKRVTDWPQAVLAMCFNWGALLGAAAVAGAVEWKVYIPLYVGAACWTIEYDTSYARQDMDDDLKNGNHSTTIVFGDRIRPILLMFSFVACSLVAYAGILNGHGFPYFIGVALGALHLLRLIARIDFNNKESCNASLLNNAWFGFWVWAGAMTDYLLKMQLDIL
ncbi:UbiA prenyltransferase family-domain-containing protein [Suillus paluster]|uniref:UbiA prenyltransferase family-domain-containing protein n=1 Tax=Suillus paluster TaxID=48578 RepID=UPI001B861C96|nr:UbiA prenyltransferase family-domain-containing protein [Suillus paluster]KAG1747854.1 UbiA prenyltransferase family-domain-containing protein [Suillus paluster]